MSLDLVLRVGPELYEPCHHCRGTGQVELGRERVFDKSLPSRLRDLAKTLGVEGVLWNPSESVKAKDLASDLFSACIRLEMSFPPSAFSISNREVSASSKQDWVDRSNMLNFLRDLLDACQDHPEADVLSCY